MTPRQIELARHALGLPGDVLDDNSADTGRCPNCATETVEGFGYAGGGYGAYTCCERCGIVVAKTEEPRP